MRKFLYCPKCKKLVKNFTAFYQVEVKKNFFAEKNFEIEEIKNGVIPISDEDLVEDNMEFTEITNVKTYVDCGECGANIFELPDHPENIDVNDISITINSENKKIAVGYYYGSVYFNGDYEELKAYLKEVYGSKGYEITFEFEETAE